MCTQNAEQVVCILPHKWLGQLLCHIAQMHLQLSAIASAAAPAGKLDPATRRQLVEKSWHSLRTSHLQHSVPVNYKQTGPQPRVEPSTPCLIS